MRTLDRLANRVLGFLNADERILTGVYGSRVTEHAGRRRIRTAAFFATTTRVVIFAPRALSFDLDVIPYEQVASIEGVRDATGAHVTIHAAGARVQAKWIRDGDYRAFVEMVGRYVNGGGEDDDTAPVPDAPAVHPDEIPARIRQLAELRDVGILSEDEFTAKKSELLGRL